MLCWALNVFGRGPKPSSCEGFWINFALYGTFKPRSTLNTFQCSGLLLPACLSSLQTDAAKIWANDQGVCVCVWSCANLNVLTCSSCWASLDVSTYWRIQTDTQTHRRVSAQPLDTYFIVLNTLDYFSLKIFFCTFLCTFRAKYLLIWGVGEGSHSFIAKDLPFQGPTYFHLGGTNKLKWLCFQVVCASDIFWFNISGAPSRILRSWWKSLSIFFLPHPLPNLLLKLLCLKIEPVWFNLHSGRKQYVLTSNRSFVCVSVCVSRGGCTFLSKGQKVYMLLFPKQQPADLIFFKHPSLRVYL